MFIITSIHRLESVKSVGRRNFEYTVVMYILMRKKKVAGGASTHTSQVVSRVVNHSLWPEWLRSAYGTNGERRRCPAGLPFGDASSDDDCMTNKHNITSTNSQEIKRKKKEL